MHEPLLSSLLCLPQEQAAARELLAPNVLLSGPAPLLQLRTGQGPSAAQCRPHTGVPVPPGPAPWARDCPAAKRCRHGPGEGPCPTPPLPLGLLLELVSSQGCEQQHLSVGAEMLLMGRFAAIPVLPSVGSSFVSQLTSSPGLVAPGGRLLVGSTRAPLPPCPEPWLQESP